MAHFIAGYPDYESSLQIGCSLIKNGANILEVQFPFSDPSADGPLICAANALALDKGFNVAKGFQLIFEIAKKFPQTPIYIMSYANIVFSYGISSFVLLAKKNGVKGLIIPDLPFDCDEGLLKEGKKAKIEIVPVIAPNTSHQRLEFLLKKSKGMVYAALRGGTTGSKTLIDKKTASFLQTLSSFLKEEKREIAAGFGIQTKEQVKALSPYCSIAVVGSAFVQKIKENWPLGLPQVLKEIESLIKDLKNL